MTQGQIREQFIQFFESRGHKLVEPDSLVPKTDPTALFTVAGMQQFKQFYAHPEEAPASRVISIQSCIRTVDIDEVGDDTHNTTFEMMGNFSFGYTGFDDPAGPYFRRDAINYCWEFLTQTMKISPDRLSATYFEGDENRPEDKESKQLLESISDLPKITACGADNFWGPVGEEGPCGPCIEFYVDGVEVWNAVINEYNRDRDGNYAPLEYQGIDTGMGFSRLAMFMQNKTTMYDTDLFAPMLDLLKLKSIAYNERDGRIIADHVKAALFLLVDGVAPGNKGRDYIVRRLIRRATRSSQSIKFNDFPELLRIAAEIHKESSPEVLANLESATELFEAEHNKFLKTLSVGMKALSKLFTEEEKGELSGEEAFKLFETFGFPVELTQEVAHEYGWTVDTSGFQQKFAEHQAISRQGSEKIFSGGLADHEPKTIAHHTAHHLLLAALRKILGDHVVQRGSNVTSERLRIDVSHPTAITTDELAMAENLVNQKIEEDLPVVREEMSKDEAIYQGAQAEFGQKYGSEVTVYTVIDHDGSPFSSELCGGPHVSHTGELGRFEIIKEESAGSGVRRIRARLV